MSMVKVREETLSKLQALKTESKAGSLDEVINTAIGKPQVNQTGIPQVNPEELPAILETVRLNDARGKQHTEALRRIEDKMAAIEQLLIEVVAKVKR